MVLTQVLDRQVKLIPRAPRPDPGGMDAVVPFSVSTDTPPRRHKHERLESMWPRRVCWLALVFLHLTACAFFALFAVVCTQISEQAFGSNTFLYDLILDYQYLASIGAVFAVVGVLHLMLILRMLQASVARRRLSFKLPFGPVSSRTMSGLHIAVTTIQAIPQTRRARLCLRRLHHFLTLPIDLLIGRFGWIGIDGPYFDHFFVVRELVQVVLQTIQVYRMAQLLSAAWLLHVYVVITCVNCWSSQLLHITFYRGKKVSPSFEGPTRRRRRMYTLLVDALLDNIFTIFMPLVVAVPYVAQYDTALRSFPLPVWGDDLWIMQVAADIQLLFVVSWSDFVMKLVFALLVLITTHAIHDLYHDQFDVTCRPRSHPTAVDFVAPSEQKSANANATPVPVLVQIQTQLHTVLIVWGLCLIGIHGYATSRALVGGCLIPVRPWFSQHASCAVFHFDCYQRASSGDRLDTHEALAALSPSTAVYVIFRHCRALEIPSNIQSFHNLIGIKIYNPTLVEWSTEAAIRGDQHPSLRLLTMVRVTFPNNGNGLPDGLTHRKFPPTVADINICVSNLRQLPPDLDTKWPFGLSLLLEKSQFTSFPDVVTRMDVNAISLNGNHITSVPVDKMLLPRQRLRILSVGGGNPLTDLGHNISKIELPPAFYWLIIDQNELTTLPPWLVNDPSVITRIWLIASGTPVCDEIQRQRQAGGSAGNSGAFQWQHFVDCTPYPASMRSLFRLFTEDARSGLDPTRIGDATLVELH